MAKIKDKERILKAVRSGTSLGVQSVDSTLSLVRAWVSSLVRKLISMVRPKIKKLKQNKKPEK